MSYLRIADDVAKAIEPVARYIHDAFGTIGLSHSDEKSRHSLFSEVDIGAEKQLVEVLHSILPEADFITEEGTVSQQQSDCYWVIDPLDGTTNFLYGIPNVSISIALKVGGKAVMGIVHHVNRHDTYVAVKGHGATKNNKAIHVSSRTTLEEAMIATGFPYEVQPFLPTQLRLMEHFIYHSRGVRRLGSAAIDLAYVAEGVFDLYFEAGLNEWDTSAGMLLVREAGGVCSDLGGDQDYEEGKNIIAATPFMHRYVLDWLSRHG